MGERLYPTKKGDPGQPLLTNWTNNRKLGDFPEPSEPGRDAGLEREREPELTAALRPVLASRVGGPEPTAAELRRAERALQNAGVL